VKVAIVVQRYGADINGGAEQHARYIAEHLAPHVQVEVLTTCAHQDYISWKNQLPEGMEIVHGIPVRRFRNAVERHPVEFARWSQKVFTETHSVNDELAWLEAEGPTSPALIEYIRKHEADYDFFLFFSFRYHHSFHGARAVPAKAILVPTAERDGALGLGIYPPVFRGVRALMYNSYEERALIQDVSNNQAVPGVVVGVGSEIPERSNAGRFRQKYDIRDRFAIYVGRIDENKGCVELFDFFEHYSASLVDGMHLVLIGTPHVPIPKHPRIHHVGFVEDQDKYDAMAAAEALIMPSYLESLSMVALEAWAMGKPVLANAKCDVLQGQCIRSNAGLYCGNYAEFTEILRAIDTTPSLQAALGRNGRTFFERHYAWPVIVGKYLDMLQQLAREKPTSTMEPLPGWLGRRRRALRPAASVVNDLPTGPYKAKPSAISRQQPSVGHHPSAVGQRPSGVGGRPSASRSYESEAPGVAGRPERTQRPKTEDRFEGGRQKADGNRLEDGRPKADGRGEVGGLKSEGSQRPKGEGREGGRDHRNRRHHRRGRRPGGGGR
jgi:glycosyltransferase involved in cell wall biosynthesis